MKLRATPLNGLYEIDGSAIHDSRGRFTRLFCEQEFTPVRPALHFTQINLSETKGEGAIRGLHYQVPPAAEAKLVRCLRGRAFDVAVDLRVGSSTFLQWHALELSDDNNRAIFIPEGFAHGFQALTDEVHLLYMHTAPWTPSCEAGLRHDDPLLAIAWPRPVSVISDRDRGYLLLDDSFRGVHL